MNSTVIGPENDMNDDIPKIFWKYYDLYRREKLTLRGFSESTGLAYDTLQRYLVLIAKN